MLTLKGAASFEDTIKKSRFIAHAARVSSQKESLDFYESVMDSQATHNCWAWRIDFKVRSSDDGEPSGTAGRPILNAMQHGDMGDIAIIVIRYFGGIKLGAGGLVRAYGQAARQVLDLTPRQLRVSMDIFAAQFDFSTEQILRHWLQSHDGELHAIHYAERVSAELVIPSLHANNFGEFAAAHNITLPPK